MHFLPPTVDVVKPVLIHGEAQWNVIRDRLDTMVQKRTANWDHEMNLL
jgi:hypothetical protein